jgi:alpha-galactosidase
LDPDRRYQVQVLAPGDRVGSGTVVPGWVRDGVTLTGRVLGEVGLQAPLLDPDHLVVLRVTAAAP